MRRILATLMILAGFSTTSLGLVAFAAPAAHAAFPGSDGLIVFRSTRPSDPSACSLGSTSQELWVLNPGSLAVQQLTCTTQTDNNHFVSPDGQNVVFSSTRTGSSGNNNPEIWIVPIDATTTHQAPINLSQSTDSDNDPSWSPDNETVFFDRLVPGSPHQLYKVSAGDPGGATPVFPYPTGSDDTQPVVDPLNANVVAFVRQTLVSSSPLVVADHIFVYNMSEPISPSNPEDLSAVGDPPDSSSNDTKPEFSPLPTGGSNPPRILFQSDRACGNIQLYTMNDNGTNPMPVFQSGGVQTCTGHDDIDPAYSPAGDAITWSRPGSSSQDVYDDTFSVSVAQQDLASSSPVDLTDVGTGATATDDQPNWQPVLVGTNLPEAPYPVMLPLVGVALIGAGLSLDRRRRRLRGGTGPKA